jgi:PAS domain S-box-containing protein
MKKDKNAPTEAAELRRKAEERLRKKKTKKPRSETEQDTQSLLHELQVHQIELEMQNEELKQARVAVEAALERYTNLYDFAPVGYFTLSRDGAIRQANLTGASLLGVERSGLVRRRFGLLVAEENRPDFDAFLKKVFDGSARESCVVNLSRKGTEPPVVQIEATASEDGQECRIAVVDISSRKHLEDTLRFLVLLHFGKSS